MKTFLIDVMDLFLVYFIKLKLITSYSCIDLLRWSNNWRFHIWAYTLFSFFLRIPSNSMRFMINTDFMFFKVIPTVSLGIKSSSWHELIKIQFYIVLLHLIMVFKTIKVCLVFIICCLDFPYSKLDSSKFDCLATC